MYGKFVNAPFPSAVIKTFVLKWYMTRFSGGMLLQEYPPTFNIPPSNANKFLLQISINKAQNWGYTFSSQKPPRSSYNYIQRITWNQ